MALNDPLSDDPVVGASYEVLHHHVLLHERDCGPCAVWPTEVHCPCGSSFVLRCGCCDDLLFLLLRPDVEPCAHARLALAVHGQAPS